MFFYKNLYITKKNSFKFNIFLNNIFSWQKKNLIWQFLYSGFYFDDIFSKIIKLLFYKIFNTSTFFFLDKWFSYWTGFGFFKQNLMVFNKIFYIEKINYFFYLYILIINVVFFFLFIIFIVVFFI